MANLRGLLGAIADLPGVINQGLLGPLSVNPQLEQMIGQGQVAAQRSQTVNDFASQLLSAGPGLSGLGQAQQNARQGFSGRIFDLLKEQEAARLMQAQGAETQRQAAFAQDPTFENLPPEVQAQVVARQMGQPQQSAPNVSFHEGPNGITYAVGSDGRWQAFDPPKPPAGAGQGGVGSHRTFRDTMALRKEYRSTQSVKDFETVLPLVSTAARAPDNGYGDLQLIYTVGKAFDPDSVVREGELQLTLAASDPISKIVGQAQFMLRQGGRLTPEMRKQMMGTLQTRSFGYKQLYDREREMYTNLATKANFDPMDIVGADPEESVKFNQADFDDFAGWFEIGDDGKAKLKGGSPAASDDGWTTLPNGVRIREKK